MRKEGFGTWFAKQTDTPSLSLHVLPRGSLLPEALSLCVPTLASKVAGHTGPRLGI